MSSTTPVIIELERTWRLGDQIGEGGFGGVYAATSGEEDAVVKLVPKDPGADRELLFVDLLNVRNVVPVIDSGEHGDHWALVMPRAEMSLRDHLFQADGPLVLSDMVDILKDICDALVDLDGRVVHRDLKPENILKLDGRWCLADFGISRYAEATTATDTRKYALSAPYAAPERWRNERAVAATDVYAVGVMAYEMLTGGLPFIGSLREDFRELHLHSDPPHIQGAPAAFAALIDECLYKASGARPPATNLRARLDSVTAPSESPGLARLQTVNQAEVRRQSEASRKASEERTEAERRQALADDALRSFRRISDALRETITGAAPAVTYTNDVDQGRRHAKRRFSNAGPTAAHMNDNSGWSLQLNQARLHLSPVELHAKAAWGGWEAPEFDVICVASLNLRIPANYHHYEGRSHSLWFGDIQEDGTYSWFETAFMTSPFIRDRRQPQDPFSLDPGEESAKALWSGIGEFQMAWPFTKLVVGELREFLDRWAGWFADAASGELNHPSTMPERPPQGSWRRGQSRKS